MIAGPRARKRGYTRRGIRASYVYTDSHSKTIVFELLTTDGRRMFRQYDRFDMHAFARFLKVAVRKFGKICLILDNAPQHHARMIRRFVGMIDGLTLKFLPAAIPKISAIEPYRREPKRGVLDVPHTGPAVPRRAITRYAGHAKPNPDVETFLHRMIQGDA